MPFNALESIIDENQFITTDNYDLFSRESKNYYYYKRDFIFHSGVWRDKKVKSFFSNLGSMNRKNLVVGHSDIPLTKKQIAILKCLNIKHIYAVNGATIPSISSTIPLGLTNDCDDSPLHRVLGNTKHFLKAHQYSDFPKDFTNTIFMSFNLMNGNSERKKILDLGKNLPNVINRAPVYDSNGRINYLIDLRKNNLVPCPAGNGIDTHRLWETLYMGGTPVVRRHALNIHVVKDLPVLLVNNWEEMYDTKKMEREWEKIHQNVFDYSKLTIKYYINLFSN